MLTALAEAKAKTGSYLDRAGLYLIVSPTGKKSWLLRFSWQGRRPEKSLGSYEDISLAEASLIWLNYKNNSGASPAI